jgi:hypothetical protein
VHQFLPGPPDGHQLQAILILDTEQEPATIIGSYFDLIHIPLYYRANIKRFMSKLAQHILKDASPHQSTFTIQEGRRQAHCLICPPPRKTAVIAFIDIPCQGIVMYLLLREILHQLSLQPTTPPTTVLNYVLKEQDKLGDYTQDDPGLFAALVASRVVPPIPHYPSLGIFVTHSTARLIREDYRQLPLAITRPRRELSFWNRIWAYIITGGKI